MYGEVLWWLDPVGALLLGVAKRGAESCAKTSPKSRANLDCMTLVGAWERQTKHAVAASPVIDSCSRSTRSLR